MKLKKFSFAPTYLFILVIVFAGFSVGCADLNNPGYSSPYGGGYNDPYYSGGYNNDDYYRRNRDRDRDREVRREREHLDNERDRLERERRRIEEERRREEAERRRPPERERCPSGFSPSEQKCSSDERRRGCRDMRLPGGLGCVSR